MSNEKYNGWTNYETWRVNLEMLDGMTPEDFGFQLYNTDPDSIADMVNALKMNLEEYVWDIIGQDAKGFALDLAESFLSKVDWEEIAEHMVSDYASEVA
jgi:hypothetical protein